MVAELRGRAHALLDKPTCRRGVVIGEHVALGTTVQFHVRDADSADDELRRLLAEAELDGATPTGALVFTCNGRGRAFFGESATYR